MTSINKLNTSIMTAKLHTLALLLALTNSSWASPLQTSCPSDALNPFRSPSLCPLLIDDDTPSPFPPNQPWTHRPYCEVVAGKEDTQTQFCVYSSSAFNIGSGLSVLTTPETAAALAPAVSNFTSQWGARAHLAEKGTVYGYADDSKPYTVIKIPGRGMGVVATRKIKQFETIMTNFPVVIVDSELFPAEEGEKGNEGARELFDVMFEQLGDKERLLNAARSRGSGVHVIEDAVRTNAFGLSLNERRAKGFFPEIARMNHACDPNAFPRFTARDLAMSAVATRDILPGEEITISYIPVGMSSTYRQKSLANWHFNCTCALCSAPAQAIKASDARREQIVELFYGMQDPSTTYESLIEMTKEFIELAQVERLITKVGEYYQVLMRLFYEKGDPESARRYGSAALMFAETFSDPEGEFCAGVKGDLEIVDKVLAENRGRL